MGRKILVMLVVLGIVLGSGLVSAMGLGQIKVQSALNQMLQAEIELSGIEADQIDEIKVELASQQVFERLGVPRSFELTRLKFEPKLVDGKPVIKVTSKDPIREPFLTFLMQVQWSKGKLLREYTVLLDPPVFGQQAQAQLSQPTISQTSEDKTPSEPIGSGQEQPAISQTSSSRQTALPEVEKSPSTSGQLPEEYQSSKGDTLWGIASDLVAGTGIGINQMMVAIQEQNPSAFVDNNINNLKAGQILRIPNEEQAAQSTEKQATTKVKEQWLEWQQSRQIAATNPTSQVPASEQSEQSESASEIVDPEVAGSTENMQENQSGAELSIVSNDEGVQGNTGDAEASGTNTESVQKLQNELVLLREQAFAKGKENEELQSRVTDLEALLKKQERIITLQNKKLEQLQSSFSNDSSSLPSSEEATDAATDVNPVAEEANTQIDANAEQGGLSAEVDPAVVEPLPDFEEPVPAEFAELEKELFGEAEQAGATESGEVVQNEVEEVVVEPAAQVAATAVNGPQVDTTTEKPIGLMDKVMSVGTQIVDTARNMGREVVLGIVGLLAAILGFFAIRRRKRARNSFESNRAMPPIDDMDDEGEEEILDETIVAQEEKKQAKSNKDLSDMGLDEEETVVSSNKASAVKGDEVVEEADVYISYSLYQQAEDLLNDAIEKNPQKLEYKVKLAEVLAASEKKNEFITNAEKVKAQAGEGSDEWKHVAAMGAAVAPSAALFSGVTATTDSLANIKSTGPKSPDFSLDSDDGLSDNAEEDMSLDYALGDNSDNAGSEANISASEEDLLLDSDGLNEETEQTVASNDSSDESEDDVFLDFNADDLEQELSESASTSGSVNDGVDFDDVDESIETAMFDRNAVEEDSAEISEEMTREIDANELTRELETFSFDSNEFDASSLPDMETQELNTSSLAAGDGSQDHNMSADDTSTLSAEMFSEDATEQFDISNIDTQTVDLTEMRERGESEGMSDDMDVPSVVEEAGTKLDLAKAFVDMGDPDAARETLSEVMEQGDDDQIKEARALLDRIS